MLASQSTRGRGFARRPVIGAAAVSLAAAAFTAACEPPDHDFTVTNDTGEKVTFYQSDRTGAFARDDHGFLIPDGTGTTITFDDDHACRKGEVLKAVAVDSGKVYTLASGVCADESWVLKPDSWSLTPVKHQ